MEHSQFEKMLLVFCSNLVCYVHKSNPLIEQKWQSQSVSQVNPESNIRVMLLEEKK